RRGERQRARRRTFAEQTANRFLESRPGVHYAPESDHLHLISRVKGDLLRRLDVEASGFVRYVDNLPLHLRGHRAYDPDPAIRAPVERESIQKSDGFGGRGKRVDGRRLEHFDLSKI